MKLGNEMNAAEWPKSPTTGRIEQKPRTQATLRIVEVENGKLIEIDGKVYIVPAESSTIDVISHALAIHNLT